ncbi:glycosyltransferase family 1 protein [Rhodococcus sp. WB9]|uniref:glycosyltransferase n=1 Tax=Rhodococcus sp. WB9 TaxID=2594007 RepID=UPI001185D109|nr:glycosyltransferase [Rhodococcus sp. WB9]QDQ90989.1 glycosyltransferase family 1 protein [Rhodococcus sp. WB9]
MKKSVAILGTRGYPSYYGGFETLVRQLAPYLAEHGWSVTVYGRADSTRTDDPGADPRIGTVVTRGVESKSLSTLSYGLTAAAHASRRRPDVALIMNVANGYWLPLLKARGIPTLINVDGIEWERAKWGGLAKSVFKGGAHLTARLGDRLVYDSKELERRWSEEFRRDGLFIPYGGTVPPELDPVEGFGSRSYALMVARFVPENTVGEFFSAAERLSDEWDVVIVGSSGYGGEFDARAAQLAAESERIHWLGHVSDDDKLFALWQHAGAYFHGHSVGGTNPALVQAMACGTPTVARDTVFNREVLGTAARFVEPDSDSIARGMAEVLSDRELQNTLSSGTLARQATDYTWVGVCSAYHEALLDIAR